jgi:hypothetical protein
MRRGVLAALAVVIGLLAVTPAAAQTYEPGELFVSVGGGLIRAFDSTGKQTAELDTTTGSGEIGDMCFGNGIMYSMNFSTGTISKFDGAGKLLDAEWATVPGGAVETCVLDSSGNVYVGEDGDGQKQLLKFSGDGVLLQTYAPDIGTSGVDQIDLAEDQCTMYYTSETGEVKRYDVCTHQQLDNFSALMADLGGSCFNLRIRPNGEVLVACDVSVIRLDKSGNVIQRYSPPGVSTSSGGLFALNLDNDGQHFFTATYTEGRIWRIDIDSGTGTQTPYLTTTIAGDSIGGLAVFGEITVAAPVDVVDPDRPEIVQKVPSPTDISTAPDVVGTNIAFSVIAAIVLLLSSQLFNETIEENNAEIEGFLKKYVRPFGAPFSSVRATWRSAFASNPQASATAAILVVLGMTAVVYGFLEPGFTLDKDGILLVLSVAFAIGATTYAYSGMESRVTERQYHLPSGVRVLPVALAIAIFSVVITRVIDFQPGVIYGFVASNLVLGVGELTAKQRGRAVFLSAGALLAVFGLAWALMIPTREWAKHDANVLAVLLESSSTLVVVSAIESLTFSLVPIEFTHGNKIWKWNRLAWAAMMIAAAFLFWHVLLVQDTAGFKSLKSDATLGGLIALAVCIGLTAGAWGYFRWRRAEEAKRAALPGAPPPESGVPIAEPGALTATEPLPEAGVEEGGS